MTDTKKSDFPLTDDVLAELNAALMHLGEVVEEKKQALTKKTKNLQNHLLQKDQKLALLSESCANVVSGIDRIINSLDKVLEDDGTSNNNN